MSPQEYHKKRDFAKTPEPAGSTEQEKKNLEHKTCTSKEIGMMLPLRIYASENLIPSFAVERYTDRAINVSTLTGVKGAGVISPGRVGYDINCGVR